MTTGEKIRKLRLSNKKTMKDLAKFLNVTEQAISHYERNIRTPNYSTLESIAKYFSVKTIDLFPNQLVKDSVCSLDSLLKILNIKVKNSKDISWDDIKGLTIEELSEVMNSLNNIANKIIKNRLSKNMREDDIIINQITYVDGNNVVKHLNIKNGVNTHLHIGNSDLTNEVQEIWNNEGVYGAVSIKIDKFGNIIK
ncbi:helix-turn-helix domain-containing protein [Clostridium sporogenes]|uniref:helix-turn-helix domain-containing protein n=1 Tax=Clostridium sporogenes TaxID=1509 RepID=UPI0005EFD740|nr:helix-turn-helix transcriptional regulator [Clostridium sporogenes]